MSHLDWSSAYGTIQKQVCRATLALRVCTAVFVPVTTGVIKCFSRPGILHLSRHFRSIVLGVRGGGSVAFRAVAMCGQAGIQNVCMHDLCSTGVFEDALWPMFLVYFYIYATPDWLLYVLKLTVCPLVLLLPSLWTRYFENESTDFASCGPRSFAVSGPTCWNSLPPQLKSHWHCSSSVTDSKLYCFIVAARERCRHDFVVRSRGHYVDWYCNWFPTVSQTIETIETKWYKGQQHETINYGDQEQEIKDHEHTQSKISWPCTGVILAPLGRVGFSSFVKLCSKCRLNEMLES